MGVSLNGGTPKSSILIGISMDFQYFHHPFWGYHHFRKHPNGLGSKFLETAGELLKVLDQLRGVLRLKKTSRNAEDPQWHHDFFQKCKPRFLEAYCWWKKSCISWYGKYTIIQRLSYMLGGARFLPSTVSHPTRIWYHHLRKLSI